MTLESILMRYYPSNWPEWFCEAVKKLKPELQAALIKYGRTGKI